MTTSKRDRARDVAERLLAARREPLHNTDIAAAIWDETGLSESEMSAKDVNTALHDDPKQRFHRVSRGTWTLKRLRR